MNREIKFRCWDKEENKFFEPIYEAYKGNLLDLSISLNGRLIRRTINMPAEDESNFADRYILQQYTGLLDKNGVEIYEGDIVEVDYNYRTTPKNTRPYIDKLICRFTNGSFNFFYKENERVVNVDTTVYSVIGNRYQTPELL